MQRDIQTKAVVSVRLTCVLQDLERNVWSWPHEQAGKNDILILVREVHIERLFGCVICIVTVFNPDYC